MIRDTFKRIERIVAKARVKRVLEVGALPNPGSLLTMPCLSSAEKVGVNLIPGEYEDFKIIEGNANDLHFFDDARFDCVLCNAVLEHDKYFWRSVAEMKRVLEPNGLLVIGTPSYKNHWLQRITGPIRGRNKATLLLTAYTLCFKVHPEPGDYYRFSEQTFSEVFFAGCHDVVIESSLVPPITVGHGRKDD